MYTKECQSILGIVKIVLKDATGTVIEERRFKNLITTQGKKWLARYFTGEKKGVPEFYLAVGKDGTPPGAGDLELKEFIERVKATVQEISEQETDGIVRAVATITGTLPPQEGETISVQEAGIQIKFEGQDDSELVLYNRVAFPVINKGAAMEMTLTWEVLF